MKSPLGVEPGESSAPMMSRQGVPTSQRPSTIAMPSAPQCEWPASACYGATMNDEEFSSTATRLTRMVARGKTTVIDLITAHDAQRVASGGVADACSAPLVRGSIGRKEP